MVWGAQAISPLDGRYGDRLSPLAESFSEWALMRSRCRIEAAWATFLVRSGPFAGALSDEEVSKLQQVVDGFSLADYERIKTIEATTRHDVKACEIFLREAASLKNVHVIHFGITSEDVNNLAWSSLLREYKIQILCPQLQALIAELVARGRSWAAIPFPAHTHGQPASPTTAGKEMAVMAYRLAARLRRLNEHAFLGKLNGATGNYSALAAAFPEVDWMTLSRQFVESLGLVHNPATTQIESHDSWAEFFDVVRHVNNIVADLDVDMWAYISRGYFRQKVDAGQVGSSTMPHKVNPINFENSEGNVDIANALLVRLSDKLTRSRMQRDLSDSTVQRNMGVALAHSWLAVDELRRGLARADLNVEACAQAVDSHEEVLAEPVQTILKTVGVADPYEILRKMSQQRPFSRADIEELVVSLQLDDQVSRRLRSLAACSYLGLAQRVCLEVCDAVTQEVLG